MLEVSQGGAGDRFSSGTPQPTGTTMHARTGESTLSGAHRGQAVDDRKERLAKLKKQKMFWDRVSTIALGFCGAFVCAFVVRLVSPVSIAAILYFTLPFFGIAMVFSGLLGTFGMIKSKQIELEMSRIRRSPAPVVDRSFPQQDPSKNQH